VLLAKLPGNELIHLGILGSLELHCFRRDIGIFQSGPSIEEYDAVGWLEDSIGQQLVVGSSDGGTFRR